MSGEVQIAELVTCFSRGDLMLACLETLRGHTYTLQVGESLPHG